MKHLNLFILFASLATALSGLAAAPAATNAAPGTASTPSVTTAPAVRFQAPEPEAAPPPSQEQSVIPSGTHDTASTISGSDTNCLRLNFRGVPLDMVLNYLSEAAGFIIVLETRVRGTVDVWSNQPLTKDEAVDLLNSVLNRNGYGALRNGRTLTIVNKDELKTRSIPVRLGADPNSIPCTDEMVTQIIPVRFVEVTQLMKDLQPLVSTQTAMTANESGNSIVITDTQANIRRVAEIIKCIDMGAEDINEVKVFHLQYADPTEMSDLLLNLFPEDNRSGGGSSPTQFGRFSRFMSAFGGGGSSSSSGGQNQRIKKRNRVVAVPDPRTASVIVCANRDLMEQIGEVVTELDSNPAKKQKLTVIPLDNIDPQAALPVLQDMFQKSGTQNSRNNSSSQNSALQNRSLQQRNQTTGSRNRMSGFGSRGMSGAGSFGP